LSEFALSSDETIELNGRNSIRRKLLPNGFASSNIEQFTAIFDMRLFSKAVFEVLNLGQTNALKYTVYGAIDPNVKWEPLPNLVSQVLMANASRIVTLTDAYGFVRVGVLSNAIGDSTTAQVLAEGKSR
jgi:hypothetical protein